MNAGGQSAMIDGTMIDWTKPEVVGRQIAD
jgi:hypothetical protein